MKNDSVFATIISATMICLGIFIFLYALPFLYLWTGLSTTNAIEKLELEKKAVKVSLFKSQRIYAMNSALPALILSKDFYTAIDYFENLEKLGATDSANAKLGIFAYIRIGNYDKALNYAKLFNDRQNEARIYIALKDFDKAEKIVDKLLKQNISLTSSNVYKAEIMLHKNKWNEAGKYADSALKIAPNNVDALYVKAKVLNKLGNKNEALKYQNKAKAQELRRSMLYQ